MSNFLFLAATLKSLSACRIEFSHLRVETAQCGIRSCNLFLSKCLAFSGLQLLAGTLLWIFITLVIESFLVASNFIL